MGTQNRPKLSSSTAYRLTIKSAPNRRRHTGITRRGRSYFPKHGPRRIGARNYVVNALDGWRTRCGCLT